MNGPVELARLLVLGVPDQLLIRTPGTRKQRSRDAGRSPSYHIHGALGSGRAPFFMPSGAALQQEHFL